jgi:beta-1,4-mannosyl-glycoprotein beta-1,4-N-acetylglucosaminyltransferase
MAVIDVITFNGEYDLLEIRLNILNDYVDEFIIVEAPTTFSGKPKPLYYEEQKQRYSQFHFKIKYHVVNEHYSPEEINLAKDSPNTRGASHWKREFLQKESIKKSLTHLKDDDMVFIGDCDEIWNPLMRNIIITFPMKLLLKVYTYYLNNRSSEIFHGTLMSHYGDVKDACLNELRTTNVRNNIEVGWHFTSVGGYEEVKRKLTDSYTHETYADKRVMDNLENAVINSQDFLGRGFTYTVDESEWPQYLKDNRDKYKHLMK